MDMILLIVVYLFLLLYSAMCSVELFFRFFKFRDTPEYEAAYLYSCMFMAVTLLGIVGRIAFAIHDARRVA